MTAQGGAERMDHKRADGRYYTRGNPFLLKPFQRWAKEARLERRRVLEPFAGAKDIPRLLDAAGYGGLDWSLFDIQPSAERVKRRDTLADFPTGYGACITNPPWLARNSATRRGLPFLPESQYDDLYKHALEKCLAHCEWTAAIIPEAFIRSGLFLERLSDFVSLVSFASAESDGVGAPSKMFEDTDHPVGLALFAPSAEEQARVWRNDRFLGELRSLRAHLPPLSRNRRIVFNDPNGNLGLIAIDNTVEASIRFCPPEELEGRLVSSRDRFLTVIRVPWNADIDLLNARLRTLREKTHDVFLTAFKGLRQDGKYRRRLGYALARSIIDMDNPQLKMNLMFGNKPPKRNGDMP